MMCKNGNRLSCCSGSVLNDTIHEYFELNQQQKLSPKERERTEAVLYSLVNKDKKTSGNGKTNSLKIESKSKMKNAKNKVKSAENLICDGAYPNPNVWYDKFCRNESLDRFNSPMSSPKREKPELSTCKAFSSPVSSPKREKPEFSTCNAFSSPVSSPKREKPEFSACKALCAEAIKCLSDIKTTSENIEKTDNLPSEINFEFDKSGPISSMESECGSANISRKSSSLDLSSLSLNSNCTIDENGEIKDELCSLELKITEEGENETETAPSPIRIHPQDYLNIYKLPEYVNVNMKTQSTLPRRCKYAAVSS